MKKIRMIPINEYTITVTFKDRVISIENNHEIQRLYGKYQFKGIEMLVDKILEIYQHLHNDTPLNISPKSLAVEIVGHIDVGKFAKYLGYFGVWITKHTDEIDCGEKEVDHNRWVWDALSFIIV